MKKITTVLFLLLMLFIPFVIHAETVETYVPLVNIPAVTPVSGVEFADFLPNLFTFILGVAGALAVIMITWGGFQYATTDAWYGKEEGKARITNALTGLGITLAAWLILYTINPNLLNLELLMDPIIVHVDNVLKQSSPTSPEDEVCNPETDPECPPPDEEDQETGDWNDSAIRADLQAAGVLVKSPACTHVGQSSCTSVANLSQAVINHLKNLKSSCGSSCTVRVTGGTEYWLHGNKSTDINSNNTKHKPGGRAVDLGRNDAALNNYIRTNGTSVSSGCASGQRFTLNGAKYVDETGGVPHWHLCI